MYFAAGRQRSAGFMQQALFHALVAVSLFPVPLPAESPDGASTSFLSLEPRAGAESSASAAA